MWGKHLIIDMTAGEIERVRSAAHISRFVENSRRDPWHECLRGAAA